MPAPAQATDSSKKPRAASPAKARSPRQSPPPKRAGKTPASKGANPLSKLLANERAAAEDDLKIARRNLFLAVGALVSIITALALAFTTTSIHGYVSVDDQARLIEIPNISSHEGISDAEVFSFASDAMRRCLTFTYLTQSYIQHQCIGQYFTRGEHEEFSRLVRLKFLGPAKEQRFDLAARPQHAPARLNVEPTMKNGRAAWKLLVPVSLTIHLRDGMPSVQDWEMVVWVVRDYPTVRPPKGLAIHSVAMRSAS